MEGMDLHICYGKDEKLKINTCIGNVKDMVYASDRGIKLQDKGVERR